MGKGIVILLCVIAVIVGTLLGAIANMGILNLGQNFFPFPESLDFNNTDDVSLYLKTAPMGAFIFAWLAHWGQAFFGGIIAALIAPKNKLVCALIVGLLTLAGGAYMISKIASPIWFSIIDILGYLPFAFLGAKIVGNKGVKA